MKNPVVSTVPQGNPFVALGRELLAKLDSEQADFPMLRGGQLPGFHTVPNQCHDNADRWVNDHPGDLVLRGWLLDAEGDPDTHSPYRFIAHSVVLTALGRMIDITLPASERPRRFLVHPYGICGFFGILCSPPLANTLEIYVAPPDISNIPAIPREAP
jgi:hypothetical protein